MEKSPKQLGSRTLASYHLEGIMIFAAVSLSLIAEEFRVKLQEEKRENKFMK
jgi:hypothetical protein